MSSTAQPSTEHRFFETDLSGLRPLLGELNDLKRIRISGKVESLASAGFSRAWQALCSGQDPEIVARSEAANALAAARLGGIDRLVLKRSGLDDDQSYAILQRSFDEVAEPLEPAFASTLRSYLSDSSVELTAECADLERPWFVEALANQPRAGATCPGRARLILEPPESHAEHCYMTAVYAVLIGGSMVQELGLLFLAGLAHHLHNATLPDSGFTGEAMLGETLGPILNRLRSEAVAALVDPLAKYVEQALRLTEHADSTEAKAFHAADVLDRVLQMEQYARAASFTLNVALEEMDLVHEGPLQSFQNDILRASGLLR